LALGRCRLRTEKPSRATRDPRHTPPRLRLRDYHSLWCNFSVSFNFSGLVRYGSTLHISTELPLRIRFDLFRFRSPLLTESRLLSFPPLIRMLFFSGFLLLKGATGYKTSPEVRFGDLRIRAYVRLPEEFRCLSRPSSDYQAETSTIQRMRIGPYSRDKS